MIIDLDQVYDFYPAGKRGCIWVTTKNPTINIVKANRGEYKDQPDPLPVFYPSEGNVWYDCHPGAGVLISLKFKKVLEDNRLTGWRTFNIKLVDRKGVPVIGYYWLIVDGKCGPLDEKRGEIVEREHVRYGGEVTKYETEIGYYFSEDSWDGSDFFQPQNTELYFVTSRAKQILEKNKITNALFRKITEVEVL
jgi:hypothetical protein